MAWLQMIVVLGVLAGGCGGGVLYQRLDPKMWANYSHLQDVRPGMSTAEVQGIMGPPGIKEEGDYRGGHFVFYFYLTHSMDFEDGNTVRGGYTPLVFKGDRVVGIGARDYRMAVERPEGGRFPGLPWTRTQ